MSLRHKDRTSRRSRQRGPLLSHLFYLISFLDTSAESWQSWRALKAIFLSPSSSWLRSAQPQRTRPSRGLSSLEQRGGPELYPQLGNTSQVSEAAKEGATGSKDELYFVPRHMWASGGAVYWHTEIVWEGESCCRLLGILLCFAECKEGWRLD